MVRFLGFKEIILLAFAIVFLAGCKASLDIGESSEGSIADYQGCTTGTAIDNETIQVQFDFPTGAEKVNIYRDGILVTTSTTEFLTSINDEDLKEGKTYTYTCEAIYKGVSKAGANSLTLTTDAYSPPNFAGITDVVLTSPNSVLVKWNPPSSGPVANYYQIYAKTGTTVDWATVKQTTTTSKQLALSGLGDELPYSFGVRACTFNDLCDVNVVEIDKTLADGGMAGTVGVTTASIVDSKVALTVPWQEGNGAVLNRKVYQKTGGVATSNLADYTLVLTQFVSDLANPPTTIEISGILENTTYHYIVQDIDPSSNNNGNLNAVTIGTGDLTKPLFTGISTLVLGGDTETELTAGFTAINRQNVVENDINGASHYLVYLTSTLFPGTPSDPCLESAPFMQVSADGFAPGAQTIGLTGLSSRFTYRACIKARDNGGNISTNTENLSRTTLDTTPPSFDGLQVLGFDSNDNELDLTWNPSSSGDILEYKVQLWVNTTTPTAPQITTLLHAHGTNSTGKSYTNGEYGFVDNDDVYAIVDACDDAATLPGGAQNCTSYAISTYKTVSVPDITPPAGFLGISGPGNQDSLVEGQLTVRWFEPTWTADYYGFKIYHVTGGSTLNFMGDCPCAIPGGCVTADTSCTLNGLDPFRTYRLHVRAYDQQGNETDYLNPLSSFADKRILDSTPPSFASGLAIGGSPTYALTWSAATDNQYATEPGAIINYEVYRKTNSNFAVPTNPLADGSLRTTTTSLTFTDAGFAEGATYYMTICAVDATGNRTCDGNVQNFTVPDITPPVITNFATTKETDHKKWDLTWGMSDNITPTGSLLVKIYQKNTATPDTATTSDALIFASAGVTSRTNLTGPLNQDQWVNYLLVVEDALGNSDSATISLESKNALTITSVKRASGPASTAKLVVITGTGFSSGPKNAYGTDTTVTIGGIGCTDTHVADSTKMVCTTPALAAGKENVVVTNPEGSVDTLVDGYEYLVASGHICDNSGSWGAEMAAGNGLLADPYIICDDTHLDMLRNNNGENGATANYRTGAMYFELGDNIDLDGTGFLPIISSFNGLIDGDGHIIDKFSYSNAGEDSVGLFRTVYGNFSAENLGVTRVSVTGRNHTGALVGHCVSSSPQNYKNLFSSGTVNGFANVGGIVGYSNCSGIVFDNTFSSATIVADNNAGGLVGLLRDMTSMDNSYATGDVTATGGLVGGIAGFWQVSGTHMRNTYATGDVTGGGSYIGGLIGWMSKANAQVDNCYSKGTVTGNQHVGGLIGNISSGVVTNSNATGDVIGSGSSNVGGFNGSLSSTASAILNSYSTGDVDNISGTTTTGGFIGDFRDGTIVNSYSTGDVSSDSGFKGGFVGIVRPSGGSIYSSYSTGNVTGSTTLSDFVGGFAGYIDNIASDIEIEDSFSTGNVIGHNQVGGFIGNVQNVLAGNSYLRNYSAGTVTGNSNVGGWVGLCTNGTTPTVTANFFDSTIAGAIPAGNFSGTCTDFTAGSVGKTTTEMQDQGADIFGAAGWDMTNTWEWSAGSGVYPTLNDKYIVLDNQMAGVFTTTFSTDQADGNAFLGSGRYNATGVGPEIATWTKTGLASGTYQVYATVATAANRTTDATYTIKDDTTVRGSDTFDQTVAPTDFFRYGKGWEDLGSYSITSGTINIELARPTTGSYVFADGIMIVRTGP